MAEDARHRNSNDRHRHHDAEKNADISNLAVARGRHIGRKRQMRIHYRQIFGTSYRFSWHGSMHSGSMVVQYECQDTITKVASLVTKDQGLEANQRRGWPFQADFYSPSSCL